MTDADAAAGQVNASAAEVYQRFFVPALFGQWPDRVLDAAPPQRGDRVLDVGCGTGIVAAAAARRLEGRGAVTGVDVNEGMLAVARRTPEAVTWKAAAAEDLPFEDGSFDRVLSQFALMFFNDRHRALGEMSRVLAPGGAAIVATWARVEDSPGYAAMVGLLERLFGRSAADALRVPFSIGTAAQLHELLDRHFDEVEVRFEHGRATFESLEAWVHTDVRGWTLADMIDDEQYAQLLSAAGTELGRFVGDDGSVSFAAPALIGVARR